jgi:hypothetical protein
LRSPEPGNRVRGSLRKELADGVGISGLRTACDGTWLAIRNRRTKSVHADQFGARDLDRAILRLCSCYIVYMALNPDKLSRWSVAEID